VIKVVSFDCYGTLVDWLYVFENFFKYLYGDRYLIYLNKFLRCEFEKVCSGVYKKYSEILRECLYECCDNVDTDLIDILPTLFSKSPPFPDTLIGLKMLRRLDVKVVIFSNTERRLIENTVKGFDDLIDIIVTAEDLECYKPNIECFKRFLRYIDEKPENILHVSAYPQYDLEPADKLGIKTLLVDRYGYSWKCSVKDIVEVYKYVSKLLKHVSN